MILMRQGCQFIEVSLKPYKFCPTEYFFFNPTICLTVLLWKYYFIPDYTKNMGFGIGSEKFDDFVILVVLVFCKLKTVQLLRDQFLSLIVIAHFVL